MCSWGGAGVCGHGGACGALGESWPARLGLWRKAWVDLQQQPGGRAYPAWPAGGLNIAHTQAHSPTVWKFRENRQERLNESCGSIKSGKKGRPASGGIVRDTACYGDEDTKVLIGLSWDEQRGGKRGTTRDWARSQTERSEKTLYPTGGKRLIKDQKLFRWLIYFFVVVKYYFIWMYLF